MSTGEFIDTWPLSHSRLAVGTVNCCQHVEDLKAIGNSRYHNIVHFPLDFIVIFAQQRHEDVSYWTPHCWNCG